MRRTVARTVGGVCSLIGAQAAYLSATYKTPLDPSGPFSGFALPARWHTVGDADERSRSSEGRTSPWAVSRRWTGLPKTAELATLQADSPGGDAQGACESLRPQGAEYRAQRGGGSAYGTKTALRVLVVGDSLVSGVGSDVSRAPPLPERLAQSLAEHLGVAVSWKALGLTGADVATLRSSLLPVAKADAVAEPPAVVVLLCGLNDFKRLLRGRTPSGFRQELEALVSDLRDAAGPHALLVLPGLPIHATQRFPTPLHQLACLLATAWDAQKEALASGTADDRVVYVAEPRLSSLEAGSLLCSDGVHPNTTGYARWGEFIAEQIVQRLSGHAALQRNGTSV